VTVHLGQGLEEADHSWVVEVSIEGKPVKN
jgi:hypothetical protein